MTTTRRWRLPAAAAGALFLIQGCAGMPMPGAGGAGGAGGGPQGSEALVEVQSVEPGSGAIRVRTEQGETGTVFYDEQTVVIYQNEQYPVTALEYGDVVMMQLQQLDGNRLYTPRVDVQRTVQERQGAAAGGNAGTAQLSGAVAEIDRTRRSFELRTESGIFTVILPANPPAEMVRRFEQLRTGGDVTVEGTRVGADGVQLRRFL